MKKALASAALVVAVVQAVPAQAQAVGSPTRITLQIKKIYQADPYWCSPASAEIALASMGIRVNQRTLAKKMKTRPSVGTWDSDALTVLNVYAQRKRYRFTGQRDVYTASTLAKRVVHNVGVLKRAVPIQVYMNKLPWYGGFLPKRKNVGHMVVAYGYDKKTRTIRVWDPYGYYGTGGEHVIGVNALAKATQSTSAKRFIGIFYITRG